MNTFALKPVGVSNITHYGLSPSQGQIERDSEAFSSMSSEVWIKMGRSLITRILGFAAYSPVFERVELDAAYVKGRVVSALLDLDFSSSEDMDDEVFPFNVPDELTESQARDLNRVLALGVPDQEWVAAVRRHLNS